MKLTVLYDNEVYGKDPDLRADWGFSCLIETGENTVLFDTGAKGGILFSNMGALGIDPSNIDRVVISHEHWDHNGGLRKLSKAASGFDVIRTGRDPTASNYEQLVVNGPMEVRKDIWTTGKLEAEPVDEQSLVLRGEKGWYVLVGCSHPGVGTILKAAESIGPSVGLIGGFHGLSDLGILEGLDRIYPMHCTVMKDGILKHFPGSASRGGVGLEIVI